MKTTCNNENDGSGGLLLMIPLMLLIPLLIGVCCLAYSTKRKKLWNCFRRRNKTVYTYRAPLQVRFLFDSCSSSKLNLINKKRDDFELERVKTRRKSEPVCKTQNAEALYQISENNEHLLYIPDRRIDEGTKR